MNGRAQPGSLPALKTAIALPATQSNMPPNTVGSAPGPSPPKTLWCPPTPTPGASLMASYNLNANQQVQNRWQADEPGFIAQADSSWPTLAQP